MVILLYTRLQLLKESNGGKYEILNVGRQKDNRETNYVIIINYANMVDSGKRNS